jgi:hypothetical protein
MTTDQIIRVLRNIAGYPLPEIKQAIAEAADRLEAAQAATVDLERLMTCEYKSVLDRSTPPFGTFKSYTADGSVVTHAITPPDLKGKE